MKLQIVSDLHNEFQDITIKKTDADILILAGDIHVGTKGLDWIKRQRLDIPILYVLGNHEFYHQNLPDTEWELMRKKWIDSSPSNIKVMENATFFYNGTFFLGSTLWTDYRLQGDQKLAMLEAEKRMNDHRVIKNDTRSWLPKDALERHTYSVAYLKKELAKHKKNVVITHHAPSVQSCGDYKTDSLSPAFASNLEGFIMDNDIDLWVHGHVHSKCDYYIDKTRVVCNPRGYPHEKKEFDSGFIVEI